jgi:hypothetical protein
MNNLVALESSVDKEELRILVTELRNKNQEIEDLFRTDMKPSAKFAELKRLQKERHVTQEEYNILQHNIKKNFV